jgi:hypothetical protein
MLQGGYTLAAAQTAASATLGAAQVRATIDMYQIQEGGRQFDWQAAFMGDQEGYSRFQDYMGAIDADINRGMEADRAFGNIVTNMMGDDWETELTDALSRGLLTQAEYDYAFAVMSGASGQQFVGDVGGIISETTPTEGEGY